MDNVQREPCDDGWSKAGEYEEPSVRDLGSLTELTHGPPGSNPDSLSLGSR